MALFWKKVLCALANTPCAVIMASGGQEADTHPAWMIVDDKDCALATVWFEDGDTVEKAIKLFIDIGQLPPGTRVLAQEKVTNPYPWQPPGYEYRWLVTSLG